MRLVSVTSVPLWWNLSWVGETPAPAKSQPKAPLNAAGTQLRRGEQFDELFKIRDNLIMVPHWHHRFSPLSEPGSYGAIPAGCAFAIMGRTHRHKYADCRNPLWAGELSFSSL